MLVSLRHLRPTNFSQLNVGKFLKLRESRSGKRFLWGKFGGFFLGAKASLAGVLQAMGSVVFSFLAAQLAPLVRKTLVFFDVVERVPRL